jgi:hypothetical protein
MGNTPPKFGVGGWGVRCGGQSAVKVTEKENREEKKKNTNPAKRGVRLVVV